MNTDQAKHLNLPELLSRLGHEPVSTKGEGRHYWYRSPFRAEKDPSFHVSKGKILPWVWNDFGDEGGTVIDFIMRYKGYSTVKEVLQFLDSVYGKSIKITTQVPNLFSFHQQAAQPQISENSELEFLKESTIKNPVIYHYLESRKIPKNLAHLYLKEIRYRNRKTGKEFFAFGMKNQSGGYEIRTATDEYAFKSALIARDITIYQGSREIKTVNLFEGMLDFISLLVMMNVSNLSGDSIIMHSLSSYKLTVEAIKQANYTKVNTFLDNNVPGQKVTDKFRDELGEKLVSSQSFLFAPHEDVNDALKANDFPDFYSV